MAVIPDSHYSAIYYSVHASSLAYAAGKNNEGGPLVAFCSSLVLVFFALIVVAVLGAKRVCATFRLRCSRAISAFLERIEVLSIFPWGLGAFPLSPSSFIRELKASHRFWGCRTTAPGVSHGVIWVTLALQIHRDYFEIRAFSLPENIGRLLPCYIFCFQRSYGLPAC